MHKPFAYVWGWSLYVNKKLWVIECKWHKVFNTYDGVFGFSDFLIWRIDQSYKSHNALYSTMHHSEQKCIHFHSEWCIVGYGTITLWDLLDWSLATLAITVANNLRCLNPHWHRAVSRYDTVNILVVVTLSFLGGNHTVFAHFLWGVLMARSKLSTHEEKYAKSQQNTTKHKPRAYFLGCVRVKKGNCGL